MHKFSNWGQLKLGPSDKTSMRVIYYNIDELRTYQLGMVGNDEGGFPLLGLPSNVLIFFRARVLVVVSTYSRHSRRSFSGSSGAIGCCKLSVLLNSDASAPRVSFECDTVHFNMTLA